MLVALLPGLQPNRPAGAEHLRGRQVRVASFCPHLFDDLLRVSDGARYADVRVVGRHEQSTGGGVEGRHPFGHHDLGDVLRGGCTRQCRRHLLQAGCAVRGALRGCDGAELGQQVVLERRRCCRLLAPRDRRELVDKRVDVPATEGPMLRR